ncbi:MAG: hypothetical protein A4E56_02949 [Pelotomaculum sp. PtaU1.Bin065]|nr:MAG: hypothetical protein A4E56_02949 [Pelotomaculum sp. PtaU1.Bin065]
MHDVFKFPLECRFQQRVYRKLQWNNDAVTVKDEGYWTYDAFDRNDIIPSIYRLAKTTKDTDTAKKKAMFDWISGFGFLSSEPHHFPHAVYEDDKVSIFWEDVNSLAYWWELYGAITNRKLDKLKSVITIIEFKHNGFNTNTKSIINSQGNCWLSTEEVFFHETINEVTEEPLPYYQRAVFHYLKHNIEKYLNIYGNIQIHSKKPIIISVGDRDYFKARPYLEPKTLLQALYLQFYILLCTDDIKKVCNTCGALFKPTRKDREYCSETCSNTAKSQRYRKRKSESKGEN